MLHHRFYGFVKGRRSLQKGQICLITLYPGTGDSNIKCGKHIVSLSNDPVFEALSYVWGHVNTPKADTSVLIDNVKVPITENLWQALRHLRDPSNERILWVDAICIRQDDKKEKSHQIAQMGRVYSQATTVLVWLGLADINSKISLSFLQQLAQNPSLSDAELTKALYPKYWSTLTVVPRLDDALCHTLRERHYWYRVWILQEVVLGTKEIVLHFGNDRLSWHDLGVCIERLRCYMGTLPPKPGAKGYQNSRSLQIAVEHGTAASLHDIRLMRKESLGNSRSELSTSSGPPLRRILGLAQSAQCKELYDKIYGLLGMTDSSMAVDYGKDIFDLYTESLQHFRSALTSQAQDSHEIYTARLSQLLLKLLGGPFPLSEERGKVSCTRMTGILSGKIVQLRSTDLRISSFQSQSTNGSTNSLDQRRENLGEYLVEIIGSFEDPNGTQLAPPDDVMVSQFFGCPKRHMGFPCTPHHFHATTLSSDIRHADLSSLSVSRNGSVLVPTKSNEHPASGTEPKLFIASRQRIQTAPENVNKEASESILGFATADAWTGDHIVRFLETDACLIVRASGAGEFQFVGCALIPQSGDILTDIDVYNRAMHMDSSSIYGSAPSYEQFQGALRSEDGSRRIDIVMDVETLQFVTNFGIHRRNRSLPEEVKRKKRFSIFGP